MQIRFIDSHYKDLFEIKDGEKIIIHYTDGEEREYTCKYIDEYHFYVGNTCYHICQFAEIMEKNNATYRPLN